jgi:hypothetical protein
LVFLRGQFPLAIFVFDKGFAQHAKPSFTDNTFRYVSRAAPSDAYKRTQKSFLPISFVLIQRLIVERPKLAKHIELVEEAQRLRSGFIGGVKHMKVQLEISA